MKCIVGIRYFGTSNVEPSSQVPCCWRKIVRSWYFVFPGMETRSERVRVHSVSCISKELDVGWFREGTNWWESTEWRFSVRFKPRSCIPMVKGHRLDIRSKEKWKRDITSTIASNRMRWPNDQHINQTTIRMRNLKT